MITGDPPSTASRAARPRKRIWPWAAGSILIPLLIIAGTLVGTRYAARARLAAEITSPPALPPLRVVSVIQPADPVAQWALAENAGRPEALAFTYPAPTACLPVGACLSPAPSDVTLYDAASAALLASQSLAQTPLKSEKLNACAPLTESNVPTGYLVCQGGVYRVALNSGQITYAYSLGLSFSGAAALDEKSQTLYVASDNSIYGFDLATGAHTGQAALPGPVSATFVDSTSGQVCVVVSGESSQPLLYALTLRTLHTIGGAALPVGWRAGPWDNAGRRLYLFDQDGFGKDGAVGMMSLSGLAFAAAAPYPAATVTRLGALGGARALGWDASGQTLLALYTGHLTAYDAASLKPYAWAPIAGTWDARRPLAVDSLRETVYAPDASGAIVGLSLAHPRDMAAPDAATAVGLARAGLGELLPAPTQTPPFFESQTLPLSAVSLNRNFFLYYSDLNFWRGPFPGHVKAVSTLAGAQAGDYRVTFAVDWNQLFVHVHTWTVELLPDGRVRMLTDTGDAIP